MGDQACREPLAQRIAHAEVDPDSRRKGEGAVGQGRCRRRLKDPDEIDQGRFAQDLPADETLGLDPEVQVLVGTDRDPKGIAPGQQGLFVRGDVGGVHARHVDLDRAVVENPEPQPVPDIAEGNGAGNIDRGVEPELAVEESGDGGEVGRGSADHEIGEIEDGAAHRDADLGYLENRFHGDEARGIVENGGNPLGPGRVEAAGRESPGIRYDDGSVVGIGEGRKDRDGEDGREEGQDSFHAHHIFSFIPDCRHPRNSVRGIRCRPSDSSGRRSEWRGDSTSRPPAAWYFPR